MAKPPPDVAARIAALPRNDPNRGPELLHVTLLLLVDLAAAALHDEQGHWPPDTNGLSKPP